MSKLKENSNLFEVFVQGVAQKLTQKVEEMLFQPFFERWNAFVKKDIAITFSEAEAAALLGIAESTLAEIRNNDGINYYAVTDRKARYGLCHLQAFLARREKKVMPQPFFVSNQISAIAGVKTESRPAKIK